MTTETNPPEFTQLRVVPISRPSQPGVAFAPARTDVEEQQFREKAEADGMISGPAMFFLRGS